MGLVGSSGTAGAALGTAERGLKAALQSTGGASLMRYACVISKSLR